ncbi:bifunctional adenosylcobinamide kinase/adenosylcobinamide-phosphate guanylyltransferase [Bacillus sp. S3]|uniref:bifunctional adenosylcobinamide kinase/adenosylcobinamide-phosphate guanylyltransferase n=1 Tax=Bacillus sp. S3 TaxID=486398 RepID=UPI0011880821|nr:bifunctional adenosylcobinamide kinase/adenosylcobinamide-phosphate guanylyltransferase [Bacillus sp. S3]QCJ42337.1 bifunctional adenosylcobinamide kinase/adenosylcobinamide-phosphate guanylyltransferase [Bacillus sp. S3]
MNGPYHDSKTVNGDVGRMGASTFIFITGGVRSGKSSHAECLAIDMARKTGGQPNYIATGVPSDPEMQHRVAMHQRSRDSGVFRWKTIEKPIQIGALANSISDKDIVLLDCVTTLLNNELFSSEQTWNESYLKTIKQDILTGIMSIKSRAGAMIVVSNEVLNELPIASELVFSYSRLLGKIHQDLVKEADKAILVEAGIPLVMKEVVAR